MNLLQTNNEKTSSLRFAKRGRGGTRGEKDGKMLIFGAGSGTVPKTTGKNSKGQYWLNINYLKTQQKWNGKFLGFWTPR
jgi:hypothetical protein